MILDVIVEDKKKRLKEQKAKVPLEEMKRLALETKREGNSFYDALAKDGLSVIGEFKKASPSHGTMDNKISLSQRIAQYSHSADAISCLTEEDHFGGSTAYLREIRGMTKLPIIRKDFIIDSYQVYEAKVIEADAILLIAAILEDKEFLELYNLAHELGLDVLCEVHDEEEMKRILKLDVEIIGINNRNLKTFEIDLDTTKRLAAMVDRQSFGRNGRKKLLVSESGVANCADVSKLAHADADALLIGTVLMEAEAPETLIADFKETYAQTRSSGNARKSVVPKVKICGITCERDVALLIEEKVDLAGMVVFYPKSKRNISMEKATAFVEMLKKSDIKTVAVTVSPNKEELKQIEAAGFDYIQIHGVLQPEVYQAAEIGIIRAINVKCEPEKEWNAGEVLKEYSKETIHEMSTDFLQELTEVSQLEKIVYVLLDANEPGSGQTFSWRKIRGCIEEMHGKIGTEKTESEIIGSEKTNFEKLGSKNPYKKFILAGGLNAENVRTAIDIFHPDVVDVSSGVELEGMQGKDSKKIKAFINQVRLHK